MRSIRPAATPASKLLLQWSECISFFINGCIKEKLQQQGWSFGVDTDYIFRLS